MATVQFMLTTNAGLEDLTMAELLARARDHPSLKPEKVELRPWGCFGRVLATFLVPAADPALVQLLLSLRSVHDVMEHHMNVDLPDEGPHAALALYELLRKMPIADGGPAPSLSGGRKTFRVSCMREGDHGMRAPQLILHRKSCAYR